MRENSLVLLLVSIRCLIPNARGFLGLQSMTDPVILPAMSLYVVPSPLPESLKCLSCQYRDEIQKPPTAKCGNRYAIHLASRGHLKL
jgi:hypothetical protein